MVLGIKADLQDKMLLITVRDREVPRGGDGQKSDTSTHSGMLQEPLPVGTGLGGITALPLHHNQCLNVCSESQVLLLHLPEFEPRAFDTKPSVAWGRSSPFTGHTGTGQGSGQDGV